MEFTYEINVVDHATKLWYDNWESMGKPDTGTCVMGNAIRCSKTHKVLAQAPPCQGNVGAYESKEPAMKFLKAIGFDCYYDDGRMD